MSGYDQSIVDVIRSTIHDAQDLVRAEIALAKAELAHEVRRVGVTAALLGTAAAAAFIGVVFLLTAVARAIAALAEWPVWTGFAVVAVIALAAAMALATIGRNRIAAGRRMPLTLDTMKENMQWTHSPKP